MATIEHIGDLKPDPRNARKHNPRNIGLIVDSLHEVGAARSIVIDEEGNILAGNGTVDAAAEAGIERVQVVDADGETIIAVRRTGLTDAQKKRLALLDNRTAELAEWDVEVLKALAEEDVRLDDLWNGDELASLLESVNAPDSGLLPDADPDAIPEEVETRCKTGDLWQLGEHRLLCGDSTKREHVERLMQGEKAGLVWSDPPYGISIVATNGFVGGGEVYDIPFGGVKNRTQDRLGSTDRAKPFGSGQVRGSDGASNLIEVGKYAPVIGDDTTETATRSYRLLAEMFSGAVHIWWGGNYYANELPPSSCWIVWDKENTGNFADAELAWTNQKTSVRIFRHMWNGLMKDSERGERRVHPTQKPVALAEWAFEKYGENVGIILDPFAGSGMSVIAGEKLKWRVFGLEMSPEYCDVIIARWEKVTGKTAQVIEHGPSE